MRYRVVALLRRFVELYPTHIWKEDYLLFPMAQQNLSEVEQEDLAARCGACE
jgi:hemerythrin-like domain-containing protein